MSSSVKYRVIICFFNDTATTEIYTLSLHDALPIWLGEGLKSRDLPFPASSGVRLVDFRSEEHTSELQSLRHLVSRLLLEKNHTVTMLGAFLCYFRFGPWSEVYWFHS